MHERNDELAAVIAETGWSQPKVAPTVVRLAPEYLIETLQGVEEFSHLRVTWCFSMGSADDVPLHAWSTRDNPSWPATGTFVHHNHRRPTRTATSFPRLLRIEGHDLRVPDLDADDGKAVIDLVAVFQEILPRGPLTQPSWLSEILTNYWRDAKER
ncbi:TrmO family methyltransferase [Streptomyces sp. B15]|uniref:TrmO family methyltransferase domain-containing protein n=1 Tax=Streptomyces sp. B15 TaxID=1537797 RepID=UPI001B38C187|nr:TrmO family methyltransferase [Streptomyces sp. B15]MBQ1121901.1 SAM-dependent methyltransferase [Streptomyces sp. B15]